MNNFYEALSFFVYGFFELSILFLAVSLLVEILNLYLSEKKIQETLSSSKSGYFIASILGTLTPFCSCSTIPLTLGLLKARASFGPIMTFLFTSPLLNPVVVVVFWSAFGYRITLIYSFFALFVSIGAGFILEKFGFEKYIKNEIFSEDVKATPCCANPKQTNTFSTLKPKTSFTPINPIKNNTNIKTNTKKIDIKILAKKTWKQFLSFAPYIIIGIAIGAFIHGFVPQEVLTKYAGVDNTYAIFVAAIIGIPLYIRAISMVGLAPALELV